MRGKLAKRIRRHAAYLTKSSTPQYAMIAQNPSKPNKLTRVLIECDRALYKFVKKLMTAERRASAA